MIAILEGGVMSKRSVEALAHSGTVKGKTAGVAFRQPMQEPPHLCVIDPDAPAVAVARIVARIAEIERSQTCGAYLFVDPAMRVFVISENKEELLQRWTRERFAWWVAFYRTVRDAKRRPVLSPTVEGVTEDLCDHLGDLCRLGEVRA